MPATRPVAWAVWTSKLSPFPQKPGPVVGPGFSLHERLQQFVTSSPGDVEPVRKTLSRRACTLIEPDAWVVDDTGFLKDGVTSACVARQCSGTLGKVGNCQIAVSVHAASDAASAPLDWRLYVPERWDEHCAADPADAAAVILHQSSY